MIIKFQATAAEQLKTVNQLIHDFWFNVGDIHHDTEARTLAVRFAKPSAHKAETVGRVLFLRRVRVPVTEWCLEIRNVDHYTIEESENVKRYDFNRVNFREKDRLVVIETGVPLKFLINVSDIDIVVYDTEKVIDEHVHTTL